MNQIFGNNIATHLTFGLTFGVVVLATFWKIEDILSEDAKSGLARWLGRVNLYDTIVGAPDFFVNIFDRIF